MLHNELCLWVIPNREVSRYILRHCTGRVLAEEKMEQRGPGTEVQNLSLIPHACIQKFDLKTTVHTFDLD